MDLSLPLRSIAPSLESSVLAVLSGTESALSASAIARLARRGTRAGQWPVLTRLVHHGLVLAESANTGSLYRLNREHVLAPAVLAVAASRREIQRRLTTAVEQLRPAVVSAAVYGSFVRDEADEDSDVDLLLVVPDILDVDDVRWQEAINSMEDRFLLWTGNRLEVLTMSIAALHRAVRAEEPIVASWRDEAFTICGRELGDVLGEVAPRRSRTAGARSVRRRRRPRSPRDPAT